MVFGDQAARHDKGGGFRGSFRGQHIDRRVVDRVAADIRIVAGDLAAGHREGGALLNENDAAVLGREDVVADGAAVHHKFGAFARDADGSGER